MLCRGKEQPTRVTEGRPRRPPMWRFLAGRLGVVKDGRNGYYEEGEK